MVSPGTHTLAQSYRRWEGTERNNGRVREIRQSNGHEGRDGERRRGRKEVLQGTHSLIKYASSYIHIYETHTHTHTHTHIERLVSK